MELIHWFFDFFLHLDQHLSAITSQYGSFTYVILFLIIFCETGLVVTPILPGDSLLFAAGALAAKADSGLDVALLFALLAAAAILGDNTNYWIGRYVGPRAFKEKSRFFKREYLMRTHQFFEKHGTKTIIIARFMPIVRTFSPFVAGIGRMNYPRFLPFDVFGGLLWIGSFTFAGYFFGNIPVVKRNFTLVIFAIIIISVMPSVIEFIKHRREAKKPSA